MTLSEAITRVLRRANLSSNNATYQDKARDYINRILSEVCPDVPWWWLDRTTTFDTTASTRTYQPVSGNVTAWWSFVDETNSRPLEIVGSDEYDASDWDQSDTGTVEKVFIAGLDTTTGYPVVELWRTPDTTGDTIRVRYRADIDEWTSSNDSTDLLTLGIPRIIESVLVSGATAYYLEENGDDSGAAREGKNFDRVLQIAKRQNIQMQGNRRYPPAVPPDTDLWIPIGTTLAVP